MTIKLAALALVAGLGAASAAAAADTYFANGNTLDTGSTVAFGLIRAAGDGTVALYDYTGGVRGDLLGAAPLHAGANPDVTVTVTPNGAKLILAEIQVNGQTDVVKQYFVQG